MRLRLVRPLVAVLLGASWLVVPASPLALPACAQEGPHAVLVVDRNQEGGPLDPLCVALRGESVSGEHFLRLARAQYDLQVSFAEYEGGTVVCQIANVGPKGNDCLEGAETYWGYWKGDGSGGWESYEHQGVDDSVVNNGDVEGWSYARGRNEPPHTTFEEGCAALLTKPKPKPTPTVSPSSSPTPSPTPSRTKAPPAPPDPDPRRLDTAPELSEYESSPTPAPTDSDPVLPESATTSASEEEDGFPLAGVLALIATMGMAGVALLLVRKRRPAPKPKD